MTQLCNTSKTHQLSPASLCSLQLCKYPKSTQPHLSSSHLQQIASSTQFPFACLLLAPSRALSPLWWIQITFIKEENETRGMQVADSGWREEKMARAREWMIYESFLFICREIWCNKTWMFHLFVQIRSGFRLLSARDERFIVSLFLQLLGKKLFWTNIAVCNSAGSVDEMQNFFLLFSSYIHARILCEM